MKVNKENFRFDFFICIIKYQKLGERKKQDKLNKSIRTIKSY